MMMMMSRLIFHCCRRSTNLSFYSPFVRRELRHSSFVCRMKIRRRRMTIVLFGAKKRHMGGYVRQTEFVPHKPNLMRDNV
jgi:hypothetical protein